MIYDNDVEVIYKFEQCLITKYCSMNRNELKLKLDAIGIPSTGYSLDGTLKPMSTILYFEDSEWITFDYDERGRIKNETHFDTEDDACQHILDVMIREKAFKEKYNLRW